MNLLALLASAADMNARSPALVEFSAQGETRLTAAEALDRAQAIARQIADLGLSPDRVVLVCLPNGVDAIVSLLGVLMSGHSPCLLPVTASHEQASAAMAAAQPGAYLTTSRVASLRPAESLRRAAAETNGPRLGLSFGESVPAGLIPLAPAAVRLADAGESQAARLLSPPPPLLMATLRPEGVHMVRHAQEGLVAGALQAVLRCGVLSGDCVLSTLSPMSHAGLVSGFIGSLLVGGQLAMLQDFSGAALLRRVEAAGRPHLIVPGLLEPALASAGVLGSTLVSSTLLVHRPPVRFDRIEPARAAGSAVVDMLALDDWSAAAARRGRDGKPGIRPGAARIPDEDGALLLDWRIGHDGGVEAHGAALASPIPPGNAPPGWRALGLAARVDAEGRLVSLSRVAT